MLVRFTLVIGWRPTWLWDKVEGSHWHLTFGIGDGEPANHNETFFSLLRFLQDFLQWFCGFLGLQGFCVFSRCWGVFLGILWVFNALLSYCHSAVVAFSGVNPSELPEIQKRPVLETGEIIQCCIIFWKL